MIIDISVENYLSMKEKVTFSLEASAGSKLQNSVIKLEDGCNLLKSAAIYGANATGKSNFIKAINFIWWMVATSHTFNKGYKIPRVPFKLDFVSDKNPSIFEINFIIGGVNYTYGFSCDNEKIINEYLYYSPKGKKAIIFERKNTTEFNFTSDKSIQDMIKIQTPENTLYLSRASQLNYEKAQKVYEFLKEKIVINIVNPFWNEYTKMRIHENPDTKKKILDILRAADFGGIEDIITKKEKRKTEQIIVETGKRIMSMNEMESDVYDVKFSHKTSDGKGTVLFEIGEESEGTQKMFLMLGPILDIIEGEKILFIDEIESSLHPEIVKFIVKMFNSMKNKNSQLIFTTHNTNLLDSELFRREQIYFTSKESNKGTKLTSMAEFKLRQEVDFEKAYLNGRFGGLPFIDETTFG